MNTTFTDLPETIKWHALVDAAKKTLQDSGYELKKIPGRGLSNMWEITKNGTTERASIRTTRDRYIAFPPLDGGEKWRTLDDVDVVVVATVDDKDDPQNVEVYIFPAKEVRSRFDASYAARIEADMTVRDGFGMWIGLDPSDRELPTHVGSGIIEEYKIVAEYPILSLVEASSPTESDTPPFEIDEVEGSEEVELSTIKDVLLWARQRVAHIAQVDFEAVSLDLKIAY